MWRENRIVLSGTILQNHGRMFFRTQRAWTICSRKAIWRFLEKELARIGLTFQRECSIGDSGNIVDFIVEKKVIVELKAKRLLLSNDFRQIQNYLQESKIKLDLLVNFRNKYLKPARVVRIERTVIK